MAQYNEVNADMLVKGGMAIIKIGAFAGVLALLAGCESEEERAARICQDTTSAFVMSQGFVRQALRSPSTADFPTTVYPGVNVRHLGDCRHRISAYVDAQNGFGATVRQNYSAVMLYDKSDDSWSIEGLNIN